MIRFTYLPVHFFLCFDTAVYADNSPVFVLRSVLGKQLRSMCCIARTNKCPTCLYNKTYAYATIFETILGQDNAVQPGRDRASHPFAVSDVQVAWRDTTHYSARQKRAMALGGVQGKIRLEGEFSPFELALLEFNHICNAGKNTNFGLGQMDYWTKWE